MVKKDTHSPAIKSSKLVLALIVAVLSAAALYYAIDVLPPEPEIEEYF